MGVIWWDKLAILGEGWRVFVKKFVSACGGA